jgi:hypothetical protein
MKSIPFLSWWQGGSCCILLQLHFCCSLLLSDDINYLKNIRMWFAHDSLQPGMPAFNMIVSSRPIIVIIVPLLESELAIDPGAIELRDKVIDIV